MENMNQILNDIKRDSHCTSRELLSNYASDPSYKDLFSYYNAMNEVVENEIGKLLSGYEKLSEEEILKEIILEKTLELKRKIIHEYKDVVSLEKMDNLVKMTVEVINDKESNHDLTAYPSERKIIINLAKLGYGENTNVKLKLVLATLPHEMFHFLVDMLPNKDNVKEKMKYELKDGSIVSNNGMVGHMLNEGFVDLMTIDFCTRNRIYHTPSPSYIQFSKLCQELMDGIPLSAEFIFNSNYLDVLEKTSLEFQEKYRETERYEIVNNFSLRNELGELVKVSCDDVLTSYNVSKENCLMN